MKAAVLYNKGAMPQFVDFPEPIAQNDNEVLVSVKAIALKHFDKGRANGTHYSTGPDKHHAQVIGGDGVCLLPDGARVYALGASGMLAEKKELAKLGADEIISVQQSDEQFSARLRQLHQNTSINVVIDYLWRHTAEMILSSLKGTGSFTPETRYVSVGSVTGDLIQLSAANLSSVDLQLSGSGLGSWTKHQVQTLFAEILPEMFQLAADGKLKIETVDVELRNIEKLWEMDVPNGKRLVVRM